MDIATVKKKIQEAKNPRDAATWQKVLDKLEPIPVVLTPPKRIIKSPTTKTKVITAPGDSLPEVDPIFQAVGCLVGDILFKAENKSVILVDGKEYPLFAAYEKKQAFYALRKEILTTGKTLQKIIVYPKIIHFPKRDDPYIVAFQLVGFIGSSKPQPEFDLKDREFILKGLWQFIPVCQTPVVSVLKNFTEERLSSVKEMDLEGKVRFMKATHAPLLWRDASARPFRFNPRADVAKKEGGEENQEGVEREPKFFISVKARFLPNRDVFAFVEELSKPVPRSPKAFRASKKLKALFVKQKKERKDK